jgi:homoserine O-acetyltransferase
MLIEAIRNDPDWNGGDYTKQPRSLQTALVQFGIVTSGGNQGLYALAPTQEKADQLLAPRSSRSTRPTTSATHPNLASWSARSRASHAAATS